MPVYSVQPNDAVTFKVHLEDEHVAVVEKPARLVTQPGKGHEDDTLLNGLFARHGNKLQKLGAARDFGLLHRLDRETSGLLVVALTPESYDRLRTSFEAREVRKFYWAIVSKAPKQPKGVIKRAIAEASRERRGGGGPTMKLAHLSPSGKPAVTAYQVLDSSPLGALMECRPVTGRLHQVRVHLESIGCPILGDGLYAPRDVGDAAPRLALHAHRLSFVHPISREPVDVRTVFPKDLRTTLKRLGLTRPDVAGAEQSAEDVPP